MKTLKILALSIFFLSACVVRHEVVVAQQPEQSYQVFYDELAPYGQWVVYGNYGYVWIPNCGPDFMPYGTMGYWVYTDYGWTWYSDYSWGWAPFHYGCWGYDAFYGWYWVPGHVWGPAWVMWRHCPGYYGWAPLGPDFIVGVTVYNTYYIPPQRWIFADHHYMGGRDIQNHYGPRNQYESYINNSTVISYYTGKGANSYYTGPTRKEVEQNSGGSISPYKLGQSSKPGQSVEGTQLNMYRPSVVQNVSNQPKPVPTKVMDIKEVTPITQRQMYNQQVTPPKQQEKTQPQVQPQQKTEPQIQPQQRTQPQEKVQPQQKTQPQVQPQQRTQPRTQPQPRPAQQPRTQPQPRPAQQPRTQPQPRPQQPRGGLRKTGPSQPSGNSKPKQDAKK